MTVSVHGALLEVHGVGTALLGPSGVGKSECALELLSRGHRLVADDVIELTPEPDDCLKGRAPERIRHYMEIRGDEIRFKHAKPTARSYRMSFGVICLNEDDAF